jgi:hypothetical protein
VAGVCVSVVLKRDFEAAAIDLSRCLARNVLRFSARQWLPHRSGLMGGVAVFGGCGEESLWCCLELVVDGCCVGHEGGAPGWWWWIWWYCWFGGGCAVKE